MSKKELMELELRMASEAIKKGEDPMPIYQVFDELMERMGMA